MSDNVALLQQMLRKRPPPGERCDFCATTLTPEHSHLIELAERRIMCACRPCYIVFEPPGAAQGKYRAIPTRYREVAAFALDEGTWDALQVPIGLAFFFYNSLERRMVAFYPSPAGATESLLPLDTWEGIVARYPELAEIAPDVEAILVQRNREGSCAFIVPVDSAYQLVGLIRTSWKGFDGGPEAHRKIAGYFASVRDRCGGKVPARILMTDLSFAVVGARPEPYGASPALVLRVRIAESSGAKVDAIALRAQIQLEVQRRRYAPEESALLEELFGAPSRYADTLKPMLWTHVSAMVCAFERATEIDLPIPCSYDFEIAAHKYLASLRDGNLPLNLLFSGMVFVESPSGVAPEFVPWSCEARYALPVAVWREAMDAFFPNAAWIRINRDLFDELRRFKIATGAPTWDVALERLCALARARS